MCHHLEKVKTKSGQKKRVTKQQRSMKRDLSYFKYMDALYFVHGSSSKLKHIPTNKIEEEHANVKSISSMRTWFHWRHCWCHSDFDIYVLMLPLPMKKYTHIKVTTWLQEYHINMCGTLISIYRGVHKMQQKCPNC